MSDLNTFAERLRYYREKANISQKELSESVGISFSTYNNYETRNYEPKIEILVKLARALGCSVDDLVGYVAPAEEERIFKALSKWGIVIAPADEAGLYIVSYPAEDKNTSWKLSVDEIIKYYKATLEDDFIKTNLAKQFTLEVLLS